MQQHKTIPGGSREDTLTDLKLEVGDSSPGRPAANFWSSRRSLLENGLHSQSQSEAMGKTTSEGTAWAGSTTRDFIYIIYKLFLWLKLIWIRFSVTCKPKLLTGRWDIREEVDKINPSFTPFVLLRKLSLWLLFFFLEKCSWIISFLFCFVKIHRKYIFNLCAFCSIRFCWYFTVSHSKYLWFCLCILWDYRFLVSEDNFLLIFFAYLPHALSQGLVCSSCSINVR